MNLNTNQEPIKHQSTAKVKWEGHNKYDKPNQLGQVSPMIGRLKYVNCLVYASNSIK